MVQFMGACFEDNGDSMLVTEFMAGGNLFDAIGNDREGKLSWYQRWAMSCPMPARHHVECLAPAKAETLSCSEIPLQCLLSFRQVPCKFVTQSCSALAVPRIGADRHAYRPHRLLHPA